jgi:NCS2 family nucleobase:cation symporter-2
MVALAVGTVLQSIPRGPIGCHFLAPTVYASPYLAPGFLAINMGGMPLFWGMTIVAGLSLLVFAMFWHRLRTFIPPESAGLVVFLVGATIGVAALRLLHQKDGSIATGDAWIALLTLALIIALNIWGKGRLRLFSVLIGIVIGYVIAATLVATPQAQTPSPSRQPVFRSGTELVLVNVVVYAFWRWREGARHRHGFDRDRDQLPADHGCGLGAAGHVLD